MINNKTVQDFLKSKNLEDFSEEIISELEVNIKKILNEKIKEIKITRKELSEMYKDTNMAAPKRTAIVNLDFDKEAWN